MTSVTPEQAAAFYDRMTALIAEHAADAQRLADDPDSGRCMEGLLSDLFPYALLRARMARVAVRRIAGVVRDELGAREGISRLLGRVTSLRTSRWRPMKATRPWLTARSLDHQGFFRVARCAM